MLIQAVGVIFLSLGSQLKFDARQLMFEKAPGLFFISLLFVVLGTILSQLIFRLPGTIDLANMYARLAAGEMPSLILLYTNFRPIGVVLAAIILLIRPVLDTGFIGYCMRVRRKQETEYKDIFSGFFIFHKIVLIFLISNIFIILWTLLLIIPGIIASYRYRLAYYILLDDPTKGPLQCLNESALLMKGAKADLLIIDVSFIGWHILDFLIVILFPIPFAIPIVSIWLSPYIGVTIAGFYEKQVINLAT